MSAPLPLHKEVYQELRKLERLRREADTVVGEINKLQAVADKQGGVAAMEPRALNRLRNLYAELAQLHEAEVILTGASVEKLQSVIDTHHKGVKTAAEFDKYTPNKLKRAKMADTRITEPPVWPGTGTPPVLCGRVRWPADLEIPPGFMVVVKVTRGHDTATWILGTVMRYIALKDRYEVEDLDVSDDYDCIRKTLILPSNMVIPLPYVVPSKFNEDTEFAIGDTVCALYPLTTSFYPARVLNVPSQTGNGKYTLKFEDDNRNHHINWRFVLHNPDMYYTA
ncbi:uncharacterized protein AMSG_06211 [Thecamonas trahens ATCC 50062]|uniref:SGF29 C-terminal domain-containing protein n=1 Tax=Thecamonas trahens ATCC 50062 TaxID=461836 RepID=A0A0L0DCE4_THETB|nr:hypothetical protein AMSG_06211 [Thecamonas trahens ATCC 50062]KNC49910.1 hypothetical protein AMSG_06211 [Thecamonas trahens ATCC 50062]|eukprot:XP_013757391.1 hypothetical protein AMSG_06211 [Thecamonas trahens ATCC 50062]